MLRFGLFEVDLVAGELRRQGLRIKLQEQPFQILATLLERPGQVVTREELHEKLWGADTFVDFDRGLNKAINRIREALNDSAENPRFIETLPRRGYRFIAPVEQAAAIEASPAIADNVHPALAPLETKGSRATIREKLAWGLAALFLSGAIWLLVLRSGGTVETVPLLRASILPPANTSFLPYNFAVSPEGTRIAFVAVDRDGKSALWLRALSANTAQRVDGTDGAAFPFWSLDNRHLGFFADRKLKGLDVPGSNVRVLTDAPSGHGGSWNQDGVIVFAPSVAGPIYRISAAGGIPAAVTPIPGETQSHCLPSFLPNGQDFLFYVFRSASRDILSNGIYIGTLGKTAANLLSAQISGNVMYAAGHLLYVRDRSLVAQPFDPEHLVFTGPFVTIAEQVLDSDRVYSTSGFSVSENGVIVFQSTADSPAHLVWFDSSGKELGALNDSVWRDPNFSPDGKYLAVSSDDARNGKYAIRVYDLARGASLRLTEPGNVSRPIWMPDGMEITYDSVEGNVSSAYRVRADGSGAPQVLTKGPYMSLSHWSKDGQHLVFLALDRGLPSLQIYSPSDQSVTEFGPGAEAQFSPDGQWIAYIDQGGVAGGGGVVVQPFPGPGGHIQISGAGGAQPRWSHDGRQIFYMAADRKMMSVAFDPAKARAGLPRVVFQTRIIAPNLASFQYDVAPDGRFLVNSFPSGNSPPLTVITGWNGAK